MNTNLSVDIGLMEGRTFIIGRYGHIYIGGPTVSKQHAEIKIIGGRIYLRDLDSTNGIFLVKNEQLVYFKEGYVHPLQSIMIGEERHTIRELLEIVGEITVFEDTTTQLYFPNKAVNSRD